MRTPAAELKKAFHGAPLEQCVPASTSVRVSLVVHPDGGWALAVEPGLDTPARARLDAAVKDALGSLKLAPPEAVVLARKVTGPAPKLELPPGEALPRHDGTAGAICRWGSWSGIDQPPRPRECGPGLTCCAAGGAAGSDSTCISAVRGCPLYP